MQNLIPLTVAIPLLMAALLAAGTKVLSRRAADILGIGTALAATVINCLLLRASAAHTLVYWFGGWQPREGIALGIAFTVDPLSAGLAALVAFLVTTSLIFAWHHFDSVGTLFHTLMLVFLAAMIGFCFSGDIFTLFVFFELMSVVAFALTGYKIEASSIEGALNFAITNSIGAFMVLWGIALVYGRTGALNLAQLGRALGAAPADPLVVIAFVLIACGFFVKAAVVPFHFWLADAHAVAPTPVCVLFSGVMVELGIFGVFRVYWTAFEPALRGHEQNIRAIFLLLGAATAIVGAVMCFWQRHLKRLLAFSTISHIGMILAGCGTLTAHGLAGASLYTLGHGMVKGSLFMAAGMFLHRFGTMDELELTGRGRDVKWFGVIVSIAGLGLAGFPPFGTYLGKALMEESAERFGQHWIVWIFTFASALTGAAVLRGAGRIFLGWGETASSQGASPTEREKKETKSGGDKLPIVMVTMTALLALVPAVSGVIPTIASGCQASAERFIATAIYARAILDAQPPGMISATESAAPTIKGVAFGAGAAVAAIALAALSLFGGRLPAGIRRGPSRTIDLFGPLRAIHSGDVRDYVAWLALGVALIGGTFLVLVR